MFLSICIILTQSKNYHFFPKTYPKLPNLTQFTSITPPTPPPSNQGEGNPSKRMVTVYSMYIQFTCWLSSPLLIPSLLLSSSCHWVSLCPSSSRCGRYSNLPHGCPDSRIFKDWGGALPIPSRNFAHFFGELGESIFEGNFGGWGGGD